MAEKKTKRQAKKKMGTIDKILLIVFICLVLFVVKMIQLFEAYGMVPDTLITCVFAAVVGEVSITGWIKTTKERYQDRKWQLEDREAEREAAQHTEDTTQV